MRLTTIVSSVRAGRLAPILARWVAETVESLPDVEHTELDLLDHSLARDLAPDSPGRDVAEKVLRESEAFVVLTPEYNHGYPAELKLLLDSFTEPWAAKPFAFVGYGGQAGGIRAVEQLRTVVGELHGVAVRDAVHVTHPWDHLVDGRFVAPDRQDESLRTALTTLHWWSDVLGTARAERPYPGGH